MTMSPLHLIMIAMFLAITKVVIASPVINVDPATLNCSKNETVSRCQQCDRDCSQVNMFDPWAIKKSRFTCPDRCGNNVPNCICKAGFFRHPNGQCVLDKECPPPCPWANEISSHCDQPFEPRCQPTCSNPTMHPNGTIVILDEDLAATVPQFYCQYGICHTLVCACKPGFVRHDDTLNCIPKNECPTLSPATDAKDIRRA